MNTYAYLEIFCHREQISPEGQIYKFGTFVTLNGATPTYFKLGVEISTSLSRATTLTN